MGTQRKSRGGVIAVRWCNSRKDQLKVVSLTSVMASGCPHLPAILRTVCLHGISPARMVVDELANVRWGIT